MVKDLIKIADKLDSLGLHGEASKIDDLIKKTSGIFKSKADGSKFEDDPSRQWFKKDIFDIASIEAFVRYDYTIKKLKDKVVTSPDQYIEYMEVQPWQEPKVRKHVEDMELFLTKGPKVQPANSKYNQLSQSSYYSRVSARK